MNRVFYCSRYFRRDLTNPRLIQAMLRPRSKVSRCLFKKQVNATKVVPLNQTLKDLNAVVLLYTISQRDHICGYESEVKRNYRLYEHKFPNPPPFVGNVFFFYCVSEAQLYLVCAVTGLTDGHPNIMQFGSPTICVQFYLRSLR